MAIKVSKHYGVLRDAEEIATQVLDLINQDEFSNVTGKILKEKTKQFKKRLSEGESLKDIMVEAFAVAYKGIQIIYGINLYKVQIMGGYALNDGDAAEMRTGEGKTLTAILPAYLNALTGNGVHIITVNEYLSTRDALNTGRVFTLLGLTTGSIKSETEVDKKKLEYDKDVVYMTNSELGFDYLRDNLVNDFSMKQQRGLNFAIVDEVDSILIDEARTPLIISGGSDITPEQYVEVDIIVKKLVDGDFEIDKESKQAFLTPQGAKFIEKEMKLENLYSFKNSELVHRIHNALQANHIFKFDVDYTVRNDEIVLIDIFTGRFLEGRQYSNGLNQAIEAKEEIKIKPETKIYASITYQNLFRMYKKLSGMSGTAQPEEEELSAIYNMRVIPIPTNKPLIREDKPDVIFSTKEAKFKEVINRIIAIHKTGQPILVGTRSVQDSEEVAKMLEDKNITHEVLNAKNHSREAEIIAKAGEKNSITISTNMAGRGTDIKLGKGVIELGGLSVIGTERHESRRIDDQLRGRSGRQGDIGSSQFFVSLDDEIMVRAGLKRIQKFMNSLDGAPIESRIVAKTITSSQKKLEGMNYDSRKSVVEYDDVLNHQRLITYKQRDHILTSKNLLGIVIKMMSQFVKYISSEPVSYDKDRFDSVRMINSMNSNIPGFNVSSKELSKDEAVEHLTKSLTKHFSNVTLNIPEDELNNWLKRILLFSIDSSWQEQIERLSRLKIGIRYRQYAQKNPVQAYVLESDKMFDFFKNDATQKLTLTIFRSIDNKVETEKILNSSKNTKEILVK